MARRCIAPAVALLLILLPSLAAAQRSYGDGFGVGGVLLPSEAPALLGTTRIGDALGLELALALDIIDDDNNSTADVYAGCAVKNYLTEFKQFQPFVGGRFFIEHYSADRANVETDDTRFGIAALLGGEYFVTRQISFEGEMGFGIAFGSFELATSTRLAALFYL